MVQGLKSLFTSSVVPMRLVKFNVLHKSRRDDRFCKDVIYCIPTATAQGLKSLITSSVVPLGLG